MRLFQAIGMPLVMHREQTEEAERGLELMASHRRSAAPRPRVEVGAEFPGHACAVLRRLANTLRMLVISAPGREQPGACAAASVGFWVTSRSGRNTSQGIRAMRELTDSGPEPVVRAVDT